MSDAELKAYRVAFHVEVEVLAYDEGDAVFLANTACNWPGDFRPPLKPTAHRGRTRMGTAEARVRRSQALMIKQVG